MPFDLPSAGNESSCWSTSLPAFDVVSVLNFGLSNGSVVYLVVLICILLMTYHVQVKQFY